MTEEVVQPTKGVTKVAGGERSLQYYGLRVGWHWRISEKSRCWATCMKGAWGHELDAITMLGIEPKPVDRGWSRFEEGREMVDLGRNRQIAKKVMYRLRQEAGEEKDLQQVASGDPETMVSDLVEATIEEGKNETKRIAALIDQKGFAHAACHGDADDAPKAEYTAKFAKMLRGLEAEEGHNAQTKRLRRHIRFIEKLIIDHKEPSSWDAVGKGVVAMWRIAADKWREKCNELIGEINVIEEARAQIAGRKLDTVAHKLAALTGGVTGTPLAS
jgi:hypothetical protein